MMAKRLLAPDLPDLYNFLLSLAAALERVGEADAGQDVLHASEFASGSTSELYGEARLLLPKILQNNAAKLPELDKARLRETTAGIEAAFSRIGGG